MTSQPPPSPWPCPSSRDDFEIAIVCPSQRQFNMLCEALDEMWDSPPLPSYGRHPDDFNSYSYGRIGRHNVVLGLYDLDTPLRNAPEEFRHGLCLSYTSLRLVIHTGVCCVFPMSPVGQEVLLGDVVVSTNVVKPGVAGTFDTIRDNAQSPSVHVEALAKLIADRRYRGVFKERTAHFLKQLQDQAARDRVDLTYPRDQPDVLFNPTYRHKHRDRRRLRVACTCRFDVISYTLCERARATPCAELGCDRGEVLSRRRLAEPLPRGGPKPEWHVAPLAAHYTRNRFGLGLKESWDRLRNEGVVVGLDSDGSEAWSQVPSILVKGVYKYLDYHHAEEHDWGNYVTAMATAAIKAILEQYGPVKEVACTGVELGQGFPPRDNRVAIQRNLVSNEGRRHRRHRSRPMSVGA